MIKKKQISSNAQSTLSNGPDPIPHLFSPEWQKACLLPTKHTTRHPHHVSAQPGFFNENIFQRKGSHTVTQNKYAKLIAYFKIFAGTIPFFVMERAYFGGKQAVHLPAVPGKCANHPEHPWEKKRTHLSQVPISNSAQITLLEAALNHQSCFTASLLRREVGQGRTSITEHLLSRQKIFNERVP